MGTISIGDMSEKTGPKYRALADVILDKIKAGDMAAGSKLPAVRELAWALQVTPGTVARAYQLLTDTGVLVAQVGRGTFVAERVVPPSADIGVSDPDADIMDLRTPMLPEVGQDALIRKALQSAARLPMNVLLDYPNRISDQITRSAVLKRIDSFDTSTLTPDHVVLSAGGQHAFSLILMATLSGPKPVIMTEDLAYGGFRHAARLARADIVTVEQDNEGPVPASIRAACEKADVQLLATSSHAHNPTAISTSPRRRAEITKLARELNFQIVDDQSYSLIRNDLPSYRDLAPERTWFISSLSKSISPALRLGWFITPDGKQELGQQVARHSFFRLSQPSIEVARYILSDPDMDAIRQRVIAENVARVQAMREAFAGYDFQSRTDGAFAFLHLPRGWRASSFQRACEGDGVRVRNADEYTLPDGRAPNAIRLGVNCRMSLERFGEACGILKRLLDTPPHEIQV